MNLAQYKINGRLTHDAIASLSNFTSIEEVVGAPGRPGHEGEFDERFTDPFEYALGTVTLECDINAHGKVRIARCESDARSIDLPAEINGRLVAEIGEHAFCTCYSLEQVGLPDCIETIGKYAFMNTALRAFNAPEGLRVIGRNAFYKCLSLERIALNEGLLAIGCDAFRESALAKLWVPASVQLIGQGAFKRTRLVLDGPGQTLRIDPANECYRLDQGVLFEAVPGGWAVLQAFDEDMTCFEGRCGIVAVSDRAFSGLSALERVTLPEGVLAIGDAAFKGCTHLEAISFPSTLRTIGKHAFQNTALTELRIPKDLQEAGTAAFYTGGSIARNFRPSIRCIEIDPGNRCFYLHEGILCQRDASGGVTALLYIGDAEHLVIPREVTKIGMYAFLNCASVRSVDIHDGVNAIDVGGLDTGQSVTAIVYSTYNGGDCVCERHIVQFPSGHAGRQAAKLTFARGSFDLAYAYAAADDAALATQDTFIRSRMILERLRNPVILDDSMRAQFERRIRRAVPATVVAFGKCGFPEGIDMLYDEGIITTENIDALIEEASVAGEVAILSRLIQLKRDKFEARMFDFDL